MMREYIVFTKSSWNEPPRLRHQVTSLVLNGGGEVWFFEKSGYLWERTWREKKEAENGRVHLHRSCQLLHHQLRVARILQDANATIESKGVRKALDVRAFEGAGVVNFNYDYYFLRDLFPRQRILTIINDDFVAMARWGRGNYVREQLARTCKMSDAVFAVSVPLMRQLKNWCEPELFLPWAEQRYENPKRSGERKKVLVWAYINARVDFELLGRLAAELPGLEIDIAGHVERGVRWELARLNEAHSNICVIGPAALDELPTDEYCCSLIPYRAGVRYIEATTMPNKGFQILARGLPIVAHGMPELYKHPAITSCGGPSEVVEAVAKAQTRFWELQLGIAELVGNNQRENRWRQLDRVFRNRGSR